MMNCKIMVFALIVFFGHTQSSTNGSSTLKLNKISTSKRLTTNLNVTFSANKKTFSTSTNSRLKPNQKWKIGRVTNKQYGIINILWQKTKIFLDHDYSNLTCKATTINMTPDVQKYIVSEKAASKFSSLVGKLHTSTPSYIEFYYLEQADDRIKRKHPNNTKLQKLKKGNKTHVDPSKNKKSPVSSFFKINSNRRVNTVTRKQASQSTKSVHKVGQGNLYRNKLYKSKRTTFVSNLPLAVTVKAKVRNTKQRKKHRSQQPSNIFTKNTFVNSKTKNNYRNTGKHPYITKFDRGTKYSTIKSLLTIAGTSTANDKVKFFEIYDNNTPKWQSFMHYNFSNMIYNTNIKERTDDEQILLHHVNENIGHQQDKNKTRYVKKHILDLYSKERTSLNGMNNSKYFSNHNAKILSSTVKLQNPIQKNSSCSRPAVWSEFPFVAVYIYEPSHVHCDAASISPHWLLVAASCLSRHRREFRGSLSAFVTFCGDSWRYPQMISYVKRTLIHPLFRPKDRFRHLFNAGLVQVVNSMADTCSGWAPASLISHQFIADEKGSIGTAVGWGLDRYDESYITTGISKHQLMVYEGRVYSQSCPGSTEYSQATSSDKVGVNSLYCLSLPPYLKEENDSIHGALLLIGGKLLALYLKEERRPWGDQSAQYASIWRLLPWLAETAREPDESFQFDI